MARYVSWVFRAVFASAILAVVALPLLGAGQEVPTCWIYKDVPGPDEEDDRSEPEILFQPFFFMPATETHNIGLNHRFPADRLDPRATGTCVQLTFGIPGAGRWACVAFTPEGAIAGEKPGWNVARHILVGPTRPVYLRFRARTRSEEEAKKARVFVRFESGGMGSGEHMDGIPLPLGPRPRLSVLTDEWREFSIDLTKRSSGLTSVICPLKVIVRSDDNSRSELIKVYLDDVRYEIGTPKREGR